MTPNATQASPPSRFNDARMELLMGRLLQVGVLLSSSIVLLGGILYLHAGGWMRVSYRTFSHEPARLRNLEDLVHGVAHLDPTALIQIGIFLLIATPVARVLFAAVAFAIERDRLYLAVSLFVLAVLLFGLFHSA